MEEILKEDKSKSHKEFQKLLSKDLENRKFKEGAVVEGTVEEIGKKFVFIDLKLKSSGAIPIEEFKLTNEISKISVGAKVDVLLEKIENRDGEIVVSRQKCLKAKAWARMEKAYASKEHVKGMILSKVKGGFAVSVDSCMCFLPGSQVDLRPLKNFDHLMKKEQTFECVKMDKKRGNIVLSRRAIMEKVRDKGRSELISKLKEGAIVEGTVKSIVDWGVFVDLAGVDSLLHITNISWSRIAKPGELLSIGQKIRVKIIKIENNKIHVSMKDLVENPWSKKIDKYEIGKKYPAVVTKVQDYGVFAKLEDGLEGLIHQSQLSWNKKSIHPGKVLSTSERIEVVLLEKDLEKKRLSLSVKAVTENPWKKFAKDHKVGTKLSGVIKSVVDFGLFVTIKDTELDLLIHYKDVSFEEKESELTKFKRGQLIEFSILEINVESEKIRGGIKQLLEDNFNLFFADRKVGDTITVIVDNVTGKNGIDVKVGNKNLKIFIKQSELAKDASNCRISRFTRGQKTDCMITHINKSKRVANLSIKSLEEKQSKEVVEKWGSKDSGGVLGEILGPLIKKKKKK